MVGVRWGLEAAVGQAKAVRYTVNFLWLRNSREEQVQRS